VPKDRIGNELKMNDLVAYAQHNPVDLLCRVKEIFTGGTIIPPSRKGAEAAMTAGEVVVTCELRCLYDPSQPSPHVLELLKLVDPEAKKLQ
jgi:hypothetical protein